MKPGTALGLDSRCDDPACRDKTVWRKLQKDRQMNGETKGAQRSGEGRTTHVELQHCIKLLPTRGVE